MIEKVKTALTTLLHKPVKDDDDFVTDLGMDSFDLVELVNMLEGDLELGEQAWETFFELAVMRGMVAGTGIRISPKTLAFFITQVQEGKWVWPKHDI